MFFYANVENKLITSGLEMKKTCLGKESKVITTEDVREGLNDSKEETEKELTEEELLINKKLSESGIEDEGLGWLEKRNIFKTINVSLNATGSERLQRSSPRLAKNNISKGAKWVENSFENIQAEDTLNKNTDSDNKTKTKAAKATLDIVKSSSKKAKSPVINQETGEVVSEAEAPKTSQKKGVSNSDSTKPTRKVHHIKVEVEGSSKEDFTSVETNCIEEGRNTPTIGKKRASHSEGRAADAAKKLKMEQIVSANDITNNGISENNQNPLTIELELERRKNTPFEIRDIKTIVSECESKNKKWKETFLKYRCPTRWGVPMVKNCSEKWDGKQIPPNLLHRFQRYLLSNNLCHPIFFPVTVPIDSIDLNKVNSEVSSQSSTGTNNDFKDESVNDFKKIEIGENSFTEEDKNQFSANKQNSENNPSGSVSENSGRMVLRNRNNYKPVIVDEDDSSDDSDEWLTKQKPSKKQKTNSRNKKSGTQNNQQLLLKLEKCNINKKNGCEVDGKSGDQDDGSFPSVPLIVVTNPLGAVETNPKPGPDPDTEVCPICSLRFKKHQIENHASECASKTYKD